MNQDTYNVLRTARTVLLTGGWCRRFYSLGGKHCLVGALIVADGYGNHVSGVWYEHHPAYLFIQSLINGRALQQWNDSPSRTFDDVLDLLDRALVLAEAELAKDDPVDVVCLTC